MIKFLLLFCLLYANNIGYSQTPQYQKYSTNQYCFKVTAAEAFVIAKTDSIPFKKIENRIPNFVFNKESNIADSLPLGFYIVVKLEDLDVKANLYIQSNLYPHSYNHLNKLLIQLRNLDGNLVQNPLLLLNNKYINYNNNLNAFYIKDKKLNEKVMLLCSNNDTTIYIINKTSNSKTFFKEKWQRTKSTKLVKSLTWLPKRIVSIWNYKYQNKNRNKYYKNSKLKGYLIFSQPKYKIGDTVRWKTFLVNKNGKPVDKKLEVVINYYDKGKNYSQTIATLKPNTKGNYSGHFYIADTMPNDTRVNIELLDKKDNVQINSTFYIEDYVLDEVASHKIVLDKKDYFKGDSIVVKLSVKDANNLYVMDGKVNFIILNNGINSIEDSVGYVPDTLFAIQNVLSTTGDTEIKIATNKWPNINANLIAKAIFSNSNNEQETKTQYLQYKTSFSEIKLEQINDTLLVEFWENNIAKKVGLFYTINNKLYKIQTPFKMKLNGMVEAYKFFYKDSLTQMLYYKNYIPEFSINDVNFERIATDDSAGFILHNKNKYPIQYALYKKGKLIIKGIFDTTYYKWVKAFKENEIYELQYKLATNEEQNYYQKRKETIALVKHILQIKIDNKILVAPGEKDNITITVNNYKGNPLNNVNLTAVSYNKQFSNDIQLPSLPILQLYKTKKPFVYKNYAIDEAFVQSSITAGANIKWVNKLGEEKNLYYQLLTTQIKKEQRYTTTDSVTQFTIHLLEKGKPIPVNLIYIDHVLVYYNGTSLALPKSFKVNKGFKNITVRTYNKEYEFKSLWIEEKRKNEFIFNIDTINDNNYKVKKMPYYFTTGELTILNNTLFKVKGNDIHNNNWIWQNDKVYFNSYAYNDLLLGPIKPFNIINFYKPNQYINTFIFEPGYNYTVEEQKIKMKKEDFFNTNSSYSTYISNPITLNVYDSVVKPPLVNVEPSTELGKPYINNIINYYAKAGKNDGKLFLELPKDTVLQFLFLKPNDTTCKPLIFDKNNTLFSNIKVGKYSVNIMTKNGFYTYYDNIEIKKDTTLFLNLSKHTFTKDNNNFVLISNTNQVILEDSLLYKVGKKNAMLDSVKFTITYNGSGYAGRVLDNNGNPISFANVKIKGTNAGTVCNANGEFIINATENQELTIASIGYNSSTIKLTSNKILTIFLSNNSKSLEEVVVVTGAFSVKKKSMTSSTTTISSDFLKTIPGVEIETELAVKVAGMQVGSSTNITIRGVSSLTGNTTPLYIVDGVIIENISTLDVTNFTNVEVLKDAAATALYGARAANGVIVITTGNPTSVIRKDFKDYAIWQPNLTTNKSGKVNFEVTHPDNITGWQMYVLAMDGKKRIGQSSKLVTSYKPLVAQLSVPQFLLQGDTAIAIGKVVNYSNDDYYINTFVNEVVSKEFKSETKKSNIQNITLIAKGSNKLETKFALQTNTGFKDAEIRSVPILPIGSSESNGDFCVLKSDTSVIFTSKNIANKITITAQNNTIDVLLDEIENIKNYSYYCMEQTASKLIALQAQKQTFKHLDKLFKEEKLIIKLTDKLIKAQMYNGAWSWWGNENGIGNEYITQHVLKALMSQKENPIVSNALQNGSMFMHSKLVVQKPMQQIATLLLLRQLENKNVDYKAYLEKINFDSLQLQDQFKYVLIKQMEQLPYQKEFEKLMQLNKQTMLGGMFWENKNWYWYNDANSLTVLAYQVLKNNNTSNPNLVNIIQYFLEQKRNGYWMNTYTASNILQTILPDVLATTSYNKNPIILVSGDTSFIINAFPFTKQINNVKLLNFAKQGTGLIYLTAYETYFNSTPARVEKDFVVNTTLVQKNSVVTNLKANENTKIHLEIKCAKEADYVMIELPIPAGCIYNTKNQDYRIVHTEFFKDKVVLFAEKLTIGTHDFYIDLQTRYNGTYNLNPAKVSLMYYPVFYGREEMKKVKVVE